MKTATTATSRPPPKVSRGHEIYVPGYVLPKIFSVALGLAILAAGLSQMFPPLRLLLVGIPATAEATRVIKLRAGASPIYLSTDSAARAASESMDRTYTFATEFRFATQDGKEIRTVLPIHAYLAPLIPLRDADGLPSALPIRFDARHPDSLVFPTVMSTWFIPGTLTALGGVCSGVAGLLLLAARRPVEMPIIGPGPHGPPSERVA